MIPAAFIAGVLMFLAPCTLPIVPGYLAFIAGNPTAEQSRVRWRLLYNAVAFVIGFSLVFILFGVFAAQLGALLGSHRPLLGRAAGIVIVFFGLVMLGAVRLPGLSGEWHVRLPRFLSLGTWQSSLLIGALFSLGWSPCIGPILGSVLLIASTQDTLWQGAGLLAVFSLGMGVPFILVALFMSRVSSLIARWSKVATIISTIGAVILIVLGILMVMGSMGYLVQWGLMLFDGFYSKTLMYM